MAKEFIYAVDFDLESIDNLKKFQDKKITFFKNIIMTIK